MDRYEKVHVLGRGSYGTAILVRISNGPAVGALRVVKEVDLDRLDEKRRAEALREAEVLKSLTHANIVRYDEALLEGSRLSIVMEYADGGDLAGAISRRRAAGRRYHEREAMAVFGQVALALEYVHARRILHRDLKSQNVFLTSAGVAMLGDFGIARVLEASECGAETRIGTPQNLSPEMCENHPYDFKADVWGLGVLLYEMLALEVPFTAASFAGLALKICTGQPAPVPAVYSSEVRALLGRLLAKRPEERPSSAEVAALPHVRRGIAGLAAAAMRHASGSIENSLAGSRADASVAATVCSGVPGGKLDHMVSAAKPIHRILENSSSGVPTSGSPKRTAEISGDRLDLAVLTAPRSDATEAGMSAEVESPKKARMVRNPTLISIFGSFEGGGFADGAGSDRAEVTLAADAVAPHCEKTSRVSAAELAEAEWDLGLDMSPVRTRRGPAGSPWTQQNSWGGLSPDMARGNSYSRALEMSWTCTRMLRELEQDFNFS